MFCHLVTRLVARRVAPALLLIVLAASEAFAQFDFVGSWAPIGSEDVQNDSVPVDYLGLALTEEGRARALSYNGSQKSTFEHQCQGWGAAYMVLGPFGLRVSTQMDPVTKNVLSYTIGAWEDWNEMIIWMDDRARPTEHALHTQSGFTLGHWEGNALVARTTHVKAGFIRKTGVPLTDNAIIDWHFYRHGDVVTVLMVATDPVYLVDRPRVPHARNGHRSTRSQLTANFRRPVARSGYGTRSRDGSFWACP